MVHVSQHNKKCLRVFCLLLTDGIMQFTQGLISISAGRDVNSHNENTSVFPQQIVWPAFDEQKLRYS